MIHFRELLFELIQFDAVSFYSHVVSLKEEA